VRGAGVRVASSGLRECGLRASSIKHQVTSYGACPRLAGMRIVNSECRERSRPFPTGKKADIVKSFRQPGNEKMLHEMTVDRCLQRENRVREKEVWAKIPLDSHQ
jgi:hypothetical protein